MKRAGFLGITLSLLTSIFFVFATDFVSARQDFIPETKSLAGQWVQVTSPTSQDLMGISMLSSTVGWAVGNNGTIVSWNGKNWYTENSPTSEDLFAVDFLSPSDGWAVGAGGTILHWNGDKWSKKSSPVSFWLNDIHMLSSSNGWIVGHGGTLLHWNGSNWSQASADYMPQIESVDMVSSNSGWAVGADIYMEMLRWNGSSWNSVNLSNINSRLKSVDMLNSSYGWAGGENGVMLRWNGSNWSQVGIPTDASIETIDMLSSNDGWAAGQYGEFLHWNGSSWSLSDSPLSYGWLFDMEMLSSDEGWAVGMDGVILRYGDVRNADLRQAGEIQISGDLVEGGKVYLTFPVKNYGDAPSPPIHPYTEGYTSKNKLWRADGAQPTAVILDPGETVIFQVEHDLWYEHYGEWTTYGVYLWNDANNGYYGPLSANGYNQQISFTVKPIDVYIEDIDIHYYQVAMSEADWVPGLQTNQHSFECSHELMGKREYLLA